MAFRSSRLCRLHWLLCLTVAALAACGGDDDQPPAPAPHAPDVAVTLNGQVRAVDRLGMRSYFAIPYAAPPLAALRWMPPQAPANWSAPLANSASAAPCLQTSASPFRLSSD